VRVSLDLKQGETAITEVLNSMGALVAVQRIAGNGRATLPLRLHGLSAGMYLLRVRTASAQGTERLLLK